MNGNEVLPEVWAIGIAINLVECFEKSCMTLTLERRRQSRERGLKRGLLLCQHPVDLRKARGRCHCKGRRPGGNLVKSSCNLVKSTV